MSRHSVTIVTDIDRDPAGLERDLREEGNDLQNGGSQAFAGIAQLHFLSFFIIPGVDKSKPRLVLEA
ncbi:MAG TPA: hypothetical protein VKB34_20670, partial [Povalibacter sp.]|nr:hypothetical protein [Povalibacter sp.]